MVACEDKHTWALEEQEKTIGNFALGKMFLCTFNIAPDRNAIFRSVAKWFIFLVYEDDNCLMSNLVVREQGPDF